MTVTRLCKNKWGKITSCQLGAKMKNNLILSKAQDTIRRQIVAGFVIAVMGLMVFNVSKLAFASNQNTVTTNLNITAGALELFNAPSQMNFASATSGQASNVNALEDNLTVRDFSSPLGRWNLYSNASEMNKGDANNIPATSIKVWPSTATKVNVETFDTAKVGNGTDALALDSNIKIFNSSYNNVGAIAFNTLKFNATVNASLPTGTYTGTLKFTVIAD